MILDLLNCQDFHKYILPKMSELPANQIFPRENLNVESQSVADFQHSDIFLNQQVFQAKSFETISAYIPFEYQGPKSSFFRRFSIYHYSNQF